MTRESLLRVLMNRKQRRAAKLGRTSTNPPAETAAASVPMGAAALLGEGVKHHQAGRLAEAGACYRRVLAAQPDHPDALHLLGVIANQAGRHDLAVELIGQAIKRSGQNPSYFSNLGNALTNQGKLDEAIAACRRAIGIKREFADAHSNLGNALQEQGKLDEAIAAYRRAVGINPDFAEAHSNLGNTLADQGKFDEAIAAYRRAIGINPDLADAHSNLLFCLNYHENVTADQLFAEHREWGRRFGRQAPRPTAHTNDREAGRRLRIGYVSGDFRYHPVGYFLARVLPAHSRNCVEVFCYSNSAIADAMTDRLRGACDHWSSIVGMSDADAASLIRRDGIDILIDLSGHTANNRLLLFALRPAPVQASWLGYFGTTGLAAMDYVLMDAVSAPPGEERRYCEAVVRLPYGRFCYEAPEMAPAPVDPPSLKRGHVTFGSFNNVAKIGSDAVQLWAKVLHATPRSRLVLKWKSLGEEGSRLRFVDAFTAAGISADRLELRGFSLHREMLAEYGDIDIALDPFPFSGGLTSCEALWMGVPVLTLPGDRPASRQTSGFLRLLGLDDMVATSPADYIERAASLAADSHRLVVLRHSLRSRLAGSPMCDGPLFTAALESAFREMWRRFCSGQPVATFDVSPLAVGAAEHAGLLASIATKGISSA